MSIEIREVKTSQELREFVKFPFRLFRGNPNWIPPIIKAEVALLTPEKNPVFEHSEAVIFTAHKNGKIVGRVAGMINQLELDFIHEKHARFGWIDFEEDEEVSSTLIGAVENWARSKGMTKLKGPYGFNQLDKNGMLTEGFDSRGTANTIYNFPYYPKHLEKLGYEKELEWVEVRLNLPPELPPRFEKFTKIAAKRYGMSAHQPKTTAELVELGAKMFELLTETYQHLPGFVPISPNQQKSYINTYIKLLRKDFLVVVKDAEGEPIGFSVSLPSMSKAYQKANGRLWPFGIFHLLNARKWNDTGDLALIGVKEEWRKKGAHGFIFYETGKAFLREKIYKIQINPMLEFNTHVLSLWKDFDHEIYKRRRTYAKDL